jgi:4-amino-4-deoxychorismate lyase
LFVNGSPSDQIPISDRGLHYGDGLFETIAVIDTNPLAWQRHMARLERGEKVLGFPQSDKEQLHAEASKLCSEIQSGVLKIILTRGSGGRGYRPPEHSQPRRILSLHDWPDYPDHWYSQGIRVRLCETRWGRNSRLAGLKHLNRLDQVLARQEWGAPEIAEGLMLDEEGVVISATQSNLFALADGVLLTPDLSHSGIAGVMREMVIEAAGQLGIAVSITSINLAELKQAESLFLTNSIMGVCPVNELDGQSFRVDAGVTKLQQDLTQVVSELGRL